MHVLTLYTAVFLLQKIITMISIYDRYEAVEDVLQVRDLYDPRTQWASFVVNGLKVRTIRGR